MTPNTATAEELEVEKLRNQAMKLAPHLREQLGLEILYSVNPPPNSDTDWAYWKSELVRRSEAIENGQVKTHTLDEAMAKIRKAREEREP